MPELRSSVPNFAGNGLVLLLLAAAGTYFVTRQAPLEDNRPPTTEMSVPERGRLQDVDSRLWQDPFAAVGEYLKKAELDPGKCASGEIADHCRSPLWDLAGEMPIVLAASVSGAPYSEDHEVRRRTRYAILAGLSQEGLIAENPQHIGFYRPSTTASLQTELPRVVPFEWFRSGDGKRRRVLLLWFDEDVLGQHPLTQFEEFFCKSLASSVSGEQLPWSQAIILGPEQSSTLLAMANDEWSNGHCPPPQFFAYSATAEDLFLIPEGFRSSCNASSSCLSDYFDRHKHVTLHRLTSTDAVLAKAIRDELIRRGVVNRPAKGLNNHIVLVSELDTFYGRSLPRSVLHCLAIDERDECAAIAGHFLHSYAYLRGLDGQMPNSDGLGSSKVAKGTDKRDAISQDKDLTKFWSSIKPNDRPDGQGQLDYLRRLGDEIQELDKELRRDEGNQIKAVGILGSDRFDKLLLLQALRSLLPNAVFFTTDLDALLVNPTALPYTHNLLIASSFALQLRPDIQCRIPPFRSSYQTAAYLASRNAIRGLDNPPRPWPVPPLLFEVGNSRLFQFPNDDERSRSKNGPADQSNCNDGPLFLSDIHPAAPAMFPRADVAVAIALAIALSVLIMVAALSCGLGRHLIWRLFDALRVDSKRKELRALGILILFSVISTVTFGVILIAWPPLAGFLTWEGQPMLWLEGIGVWPTVVLRGATLVLCVLLTYHAFVALNQNMKRISKEMLIADKWDTVAQDRKHAGHLWLKDASRSFYIPAQDIGPAGKGDFFWQKYVFQGYLSSRLIRVGAGVIIMLGLWLILHSIFGNSPAPARGAISYWLYRAVTLFLVIAILFLIFFVADATFLCWRAIRELGGDGNMWPDKTLDDFCHRLGLLKEDLDDWIDLTFIAKRTTYITWLIYIPFFIIALLVFSRSQLFANFGPSIPDLITMSVAVLILIGCAVALRSAAEDSRKQALKRLHEKIILAKKSANGTRRADQLSTLCQWIEDLRDGAFSPFSQQPLIRALLLPLGSFGGVALLEYFLLPGGLS
jgi:hypothetical protein